MITAQNLAEMAVEQFHEQFCWRSQIPKEFLEGQSRPFKIYCKADGTNAAHWFESPFYSNSSEEVFFVCVKEAVRTLLDACDTYAKGGGLVCRSFRQDTYTENIKDQAVFEKYGVQLRAVISEEPSELETDRLRFKIQIAFDVEAI